MTIKTHKLAIPLLVVLTLVLSILTAPKALAEIVYLERGHVDIMNVTAEDGELNLQLKEDVTAPHTVRNPEDVRLIIGDAAKNYADRNRKNIPPLNDVEYLLPQNQDPDIIWMGWDTIAAASGGFTDVGLEITGLTAPAGGAIKAAINRDFTFEPVTDGKEYTLGVGSVIRQAFPGHTHLFWGFSKPGEYTMTVVAKSNGKESQPATLTFHVGDIVEPEPTTTSAPEPAPSSTTSTPASAPTSTTSQPVASTSSSTKPQPTTPASSSASNQGVLAIILAIVAIIGGIAAAAFAGKLPLPHL